MKIYRSISFLKLHNVHLNLNTYVLHSIKTLRQYIFVLCSFIQIYKINYPIYFPLCVYGYANAIDKKYRLINEEKKATYLTLSYSSPPN